MEGESLMNWDYNFAKEFKKRDNKDVDEPIIGTVISISPLNISLFNGSVILNNSNSYVCSNLSILNGTCIVDGKTGTCTIDRSLKVEDKVLCVPSNSGQTYFIIDKVVI